MQTRAQFRNAPATNGNSPDIGPEPLTKIPWRILTAAGLGIAVIAALLGATIVQSPCSNYSDKISDLETLIFSGKTDTALGLADLALSTTKLCESSKLAVAELRYSATMQEIFKHPQGAGDAATLRWQEAEAKADEYKVPKEKRPTMSVVVQAYNAGLWQLAHAAFLKAWTEGTVRPQDLQAVNIYYATLRNWGKNSHQPQLSRTACEISRSYSLSGEACSDLVYNFGTDESNWPLPDATDLILAAGKK